MRRFGQFVLPEGNQYLVFHSLPDQDCMIPNYLFHYMFDLPFGAAGVQLRFVLPGERYELQPGETGSVWHFDTGRLFNLVQRNCDHHASRDYILYPCLTDGREVTDRTKVVLPFPYDSTAHIMYELGIRGTEKDTPAIRALLRFNRQADTGGRFGRLPQTVFDDVDIANECLTNVVNGLGRFIVQSDNPSYFGKLLKSFPDRMSDLEKMIFSFYFIDAYVKTYEETNHDGLAELRPLVDESVEDELPASLASDCDDSDGGGRETQLIMLTGEDFGYWGPAEVATTSAKNRLKNRLAASRQVLLVLPELPSFSESLAEALIRRIAIRWPIQFRRVFMRENDLGGFDAFSDEVDADTLVIHLNTGGQYNPNDFMFDERAENFPHASLPEAIFDWLYIQHLTPPFVFNILKWNQFMIDEQSGRLTPRLSSRRLVEVETLYRELVGLHGPVAMFALNHHAPVYMQPAFDSLYSSISSGQNDFMSDELFTELVVMMIMNYFDEMTTMAEIKNYIKYNSRSLNPDGVKILVVPENRFATKRMRQVANRRPYNDRYDVMVAEFTEQDDGTRFGITILNSGRMYAGMDLIFAELIALDPSMTRAFLHPEHFVIYLKDDTALTMDDLIAVVAKHLRFTSYRQGQAPSIMDEAEAA